MRKRYRNRDYTPNMLPQTRKEVFFDVIKLHWFSLLMLGFLLLAAFLPVLFITISNDAYEAKLLSQLPADVTQEVIRQAQMEAAAFRNTAALLSIPGYLIFAVALAGVLRLIRQYALEEIAFFRHDLLVGIRQNGKHTMLIALFMGVQKAVGLYLTSSGSFAQSGLPGTVGTVFNGLSVFVFLPIWAYMLVFTALYDNRFLQNMKLAFALYAKTLGKTLLVLPALGVAFVVSQFPYFLCHILGMVIGVLLLPVCLLIWTLFAYDQLDRHINPIYFPELVGKGLYKPEV